MTTLTIQGVPAQRVPERALALLNVLGWGAQLARRVRADEPTTAEEVLAWARQLEATEPALAADLRAAALAAQKDGIRA